MQSKIAYNFGRLHVLWGRILTCIGLISMQMLVGGLCRVLVYHELLLETGIGIYYKSEGREAVTESFLLLARMPIILIVSRYADFLAGTRFPHVVCRNLLK